MIEHYKIYMNLPSRVKDSFICKCLIPYLREKEFSNYWIERRVEMLPVIHIYITKNKRTNETISKAPSHLEPLKSIIKEFVNDLSEEEKEEKEVYVKYNNEIRKMNRLGRLQRMPKNLSVTFEELQYVKRSGEYTYAEEPMIFNDTFKRLENLYEDTYLYLFNHRNQEILFILGLFYFSSKNLDRTGIGKGYRSYQSHVLGFLSYKKADMESYKKYFEDYYRKNITDLLKFYRMIADNKTFCKSNLKIIVLLKRWKQALDEMYQKLFYVQQDNNLSISIVETIKSKIARHKFRKISQFHNIVFDKNHKFMFDTKEFNAYRMLVNFTYLILPNLGISSRKRVQVGYILVKIAQKEEEE